VGTELLSKNKTMKMFKIVVLSLLVKSFLLLRAQDVPPPNPALNINIVSGQGIVFHFNEISHYTDGIMDAGQSTFIRVGSVSDWKLQFHAEDNTFYGEINPMNQMELNNVGLTVISTGTNLDDGSNILNYAKLVPLALQQEEITVLNKGTGSNRGWGIENSFILNWEMGTKRGNMNNQSLLEQMIPPDSYTVSIILTLSIYP